MKVLRLLSRVAFICNICLLAASLLRYLPKPPEGDLVSTVIVMGYILSVFVNGLVNCWAGIALLAGRLKRGMVPVWLLIVNFIFFIIQLIIIIRHP